MNTIPNLTVVKIGGSTIDAPNLLGEFAESIANVSQNHLPVVVHGGGKDIARSLDAMNKEFTFIDGMRVTDEETVRVVQQVLSGDVNKRIVNEMVMKRIPAIGLSGVDGGLFTADKKLSKSGQDIGLVGEITHVSGAVIDLVFAGGYIPVVSPVSRGIDGTIYNVNADLAASELAIALGAEDLIFISDVDGVKVGGAVQKIIRISEIENLISTGEVSGGMIPKLQSAADAVERGVGRVHICSWHGAATLGDELSDDRATGTVVTK